MEVHRLQIAFLGKEWPDHLVGAKTRTSLISVAS